MGRLFRYLGSYKRWLYFSVGSSVANKVLDLMPPLLVAWAVDVVSRNPPAWLVSLLGTGELWPLAVFIAVLAVVVFAFESVFEWMFQYGYMGLAQRVQHDLRLDAYGAIQNREMAFFEEHRTGETMAMLNDDVNQLERFLNTGLNDLVQLGTLFLFAGFVLFTTSWQLALVGLAPLPLIVLGSLWYTRLISPRYRRVRQTVGELSSRLENNLGGMPVIKAFTAEPYEMERVRKASAAYRDANVHAIKLSAAYVPLIRTGIALGFAGVLFAGAYWVIHGEQHGITVGLLVLFAMMIQRLLWPMTRLGNTLNEYERAKAAARRTFGLLDTPPELSDPEQPQSFAPSPAGQTSTGATRAQGRVSFDGVEFRYRRGVPVLRGLTFEVAPGEMVGIAGPTGAGKSTLIKLLLRYYDVTGGAVRIDGLDVRDLSVTELRRQLALVSQDVYLFHGSIAENIAYGREESEAEIVRAAKLAQLHGFVQSLPQGYDTIVGERGIKLSGGQRQRLSIARAILKDAPILVLDEATSSVDTETEREIQQNLDRLAEGRTAVVIAHRLSTIRGADRILVMSEGHVVEEGHHDDLLARGGTYADLWRIQSGEGARA